MSADVPTAVRSTPQSLATENANLGQYNSSIRRGLLSDCIHLNALRPGCLYMNPDRLLNGNGVSLAVTRLKACSSPWLGSWSSKVCRKPPTSRGSRAAVWISMEVSVIARLNSFFASERNIWVVCGSGRSARRLNQEALTTCIVQYSEEARDLPKTILIAFPLPFSTYLFVFACSS